MITPEDDTLEPGNPVTMTVFENEWLGHQVTEAYPELLTAHTLQHLQAALLNRATYRWPTTVIKGYVQSGKTMNMIKRTLFDQAVGYSTIILLRALQADKEQYMDRASSIFQHFYGVSAYHEHLIDVTGSANLSIYRYPASVPRCFVGIITPVVLRNLINRFGHPSHDAPFKIYIDESDYVDAGGRSQKDALIEHLKAASNGVVSVSATVLDEVVKAGIEHIEVIPPPVHYKGIPAIQFVPIEQGTSKFTDSVSVNLFETDPGLAAFVEYVSKKAWSDQFPVVALVSICSGVKPNHEAARQLAGQYPTMDFVVYNGTGITEYSPSPKNHSLSMGQYLRLKQSQTSVAPRNMVIFAGRLAERGISFVSHRTSKDPPEFVPWHLTVMRLLVSDTTPEPELLQRVRLCGIFNDPYELELHVTPSTQIDIQNAYCRQEEIIRAILEGDEPSEQVVRNFPNPESSLGKRNVFRQTLHKRVRLNKTAGASRQMTRKYFVSSGSEFDLEVPAAATMKSPVVLESESEVDSGSESGSESDFEDDGIQRYFIIDETRLGEHTVARALVEQTILQMIDHDRIGVTVPRTEINQWLLESEKVNDQGDLLFRGCQQINGNWSTLHAKMHQTDDANRPGALLCWKDQRQMFLKYNP